MNGIHSGQSLFSILFFFLTLLIIYRPTFFYVSWVLLLINPLTFQLLLVSNHQLFLWSNFSCRCCCSTQRRPCWVCALWRPTVKNSSHLLYIPHIIIPVSKFQSATLTSWAHFGRDEAFESIQFYLSFSTLEKTLVSRIKERNSWAGFSTAAIQTAHLKTGSSIFRADQQFWRIFSLFGGLNWPLGYSGQNWQHKHRQKTIPSQLEQLESCTDKKDLCLIFTTTCLIVDFLMTRNSSLFA